MIILHFVYFMPVVFYYHSAIYTAYNKASLFLRWIGSVQPTKLRKKLVHLSRWTTFLSWDSPIVMDRSTGRFRPILGHNTPPHAQHWIANSGSICVTLKSMCSYKKSVADSQAQGMLWLLMALNNDLFPEKIWNVLFVIRKSRCVWTHTANILERSARSG